MSRRLAAADARNCGCRPSPDLCRADPRSGAPSPLITPAIATGRPSERPGPHTHEAAGLHGETTMPGAIKFGDEFLVNTITTGSQYGPAITGLSNGRFVAAWADNSMSPDDPSDGAVRAQLFNA